MAGEVIASGEVQVGIDLAAAEAGLRKLEADFDRSMAAIDRQKAEARVTADTTGLDAKIAKVKREILELDKMRADPEVHLDTKAAKAEMKALRAELKELQQKKTEIRVDSSQLRDANRQAAISSKRQAEMSRQSERASRASEKLARMKSKESGALVQNAHDVNRLRESYARLRGEEDRLTRKTGRPGGIFRTASETRALERVRSELALTEHKVRRLGGSVSDIDPDLERHQGTLHRWASSLGRVRVHLGLFSLSLKQMGAALAIFGPVITGLIGSASALIGVLGTGLAGAISVGGAALGGFALSALGVGLILKPIVSELKAATKASRAYNDAILKYGRGSDEARTAQEKLNQTLKGISPAARRAIVDWGSMKTRWDALTKSARAPIFESFGQSLRTVQALLPSFARQSVATTRVATDGWNKWMAAIRSPAAKAGLNELMANFRAGLPSLMDGFQSLATIMGRVSVSASKMLPSLNQGFAAWARNLMGAVGSGAALDKKMQRLVTHMRDIGHLAQASGRLMANFFGSGADAGDDLVKTLTRVFNRWSDWMGTVEGRRSLQKFFAESAAEAKTFFAAFASLGRILFQFSRAVAPISDGLFKVLKLIGDIVTAAASIEGVNNALQGVGATLAAIWVVGRVKAFTNAVMGAARALGLLAAAEGTTAVAAGAGGGSLLGRIFGRGGPKAATAGLAAAGTQMTLFGARAGAAAGAAGLFGAAVAAPVLVPVATIGALALFIGKLEETRSEFGELQVTTNRAREALLNTGQALGKADRNLAEAKDKVSESASREARILRQLANLTREGMVATPKWNKLMSQLSATQTQHSRAIRNETQAMQDRVKAQQRTAALQKEAVNSARKQVKAAADQAKTQAYLIGSERELAMIRRARSGPEKQLAAAISAANAAEDKLALSQLNRTRIQRGLAAISYRLAGALGQVTRRLGSAAAAKIGNIVDPQAAGQVARLSSKLAGLGQGRTVKTILLNVQGEQNVLNALRKVDAITIKDKTTHAKANIKAAIGQLAALAGIKLKDKTLRAEGDMSAAIRAIGGLLGIRLPEKIQRILADANPALSVLERLASYVLPPIVQRIITSHSGKAEGGPAQYTNDAEVERQLKMQERAPIRPNRSQQVRRPTMLVGEEGPSHPEWVIASNPAYRGANEMYLEAAAFEFGYMLVPGHRTGLARAKRAPRVRNIGLGQAMVAPAGGGGGGGGASASAKPRKLQRTKSGRKHPSKSAQQAYHDPAYDYWHSQIDRWASEYSNDTTRQDEDIDAGRRTAYDFGELIGDLTNEDNSYGSLVTTIQNMLNYLTGVNGNANATLDRITPGDIKRQRSLVNKLQRAIPTRQGRKESDASYRKRKQLAENKYTKSKNQLERMESRRSSALTQAPESYDQMGELMREMQDQIPPERESIANDIRYLQDVQGGMVDAPYADSAGSGGSGAPTIGEQTATVNSAKYDLYKQFASNIIGAVLPNKVGGSLAGAGPGGAGGPVASMGYLPGSIGHLFSGTGSASSGTGPTPGPNTVSVTNHFAAPPPDPHTWSRQQEFELGALA